MTTTALINPNPVYIDATGTTCFGIVYASSDPKLTVTHSTYYTAHPASEFECWLQIYPSINYIPINPAVLV